MARRQPRRPSDTRAAVRDALWRMGAVLGSVVGLLIALDQHVDPAQSAACKTPDADAIGRCASEEFIAAATPYAIGLIGGLAVGGVVGLAVAQLLLPRRRRELHNNAR